MQYIIDHVAAIVIGAALIFMLAALSMRANDSSIEAVQVDLGKSELRSLVDIMEQDFNNMGAGMVFPNTTSARRVIQEFGPGSGSDAGYTVLRFWALQDASGTMNPVLVSYRWRQQGSTTLHNGTSVNLYEVERSTPGGGVASYENVTGFSVALTDRAFASVPAGSATLEEARYLDVDLGMVSPVGVEGLLEQTRWAKQFRPLNMNPEGTRVIQASCVPITSC